MPTQLERQTLNERELAKLTALYQKAQRDIVNTFEGATDFGQARRIEQLANIDRILRGLGVASGDFVDIVLGDSYKRGTEDALSQLEAIRVGIKDKSTMSVIDQRAVAALVSETQEAFAQSLTTVGRSANKALGDATRAVITDQIAEGRILGQTLKQVSAAIKATIKTDGITALVDKRGVEWSLERYADMLARTKMVEARNTGLANKMLANGYDLVQVSNHASKHSACAALEGKILSLTGKTKGYMTLAEAKANGLFHPNCRHQINVIQTDYMALTKAYDRESGQYVPSFKANLPAVNPAPTRALAPKANAPISVAGGAFTGEPVIGGKMTIRAGTKKLEVRVNAVEERFINDTQLRVTTMRNPLIRRVSATTRGYYVDRSHSMHIKRVDAATTHTFYHELGHALDNKINAKTPWLSSTPEVKAALRADAKMIVAHRMLKMYANQGIKLDGIKQTLALISGQTIEYKIGERVGTLRSDPKWRKYAGQADEVFADAYAQYRTDPKKFSVYAPSVSDIFKELIK